MKIENLTKLKSKSKKRLGRGQGSGKGNPRISKKPVTVSLGALDTLPKGTTVDINSLIKFKIVDKNDAQKYGVKILGNGNIKHPLSFNINASKEAIEKIKKSGGKILTEQSQ